MRNRFKNSWFSLLMFLAAACLVYYPVLGNKARNPDAGIILPPLFEIRNPLEYLSMLANFEVIDFQPVRDLTFFVDIFIFKLSGIVTFATTNALLWGMAMYFFYRLLQRVVEADRQKYLILWALAFTVYPLFSQVIPWGMARKHVLAFLLILIATHAFLDWLEGKGSFLRHYLLYVLSALSHPITILWPVWAFIHFYLYADETRKAERKRFTIYILTAAILLFTNWAYYTIGNQKVSDIFGNVRPDYFDFTRNFTNFCFYLRQIIWPYELGFLNQPDIHNSWPGFLLLIMCLIFAWIHRKEKSTYSWFAFALFPFPIFISLPGVFDQYLLIPTAGLVILLVHKFHRSSKLFAAMASIFIIGWGAITFNESTYWTDTIKISLRNFHNSKSCKSSAEVLLNHYYEKKPVPEDIREYFLNQKCREVDSQAPFKIIISYLYVEALILYYETERFTYEERVERLKQLALINYYPDLILAALYSQNERDDDIEEIAFKIQQKTNGMKLETGPVIDDVLRPYCEKKKLETCLQITVPNRIEVPYL